jgi:hypothetical protein
MSLSRGERMIKAAAVALPRQKESAIYDLNWCIHQVLEILFGYAMANDLKIAIVISKTCAYGSKLMNDTLDAHTNNATPEPLPLTTRRRRMSSKLKLCIECGRPSAFTRVVGVVELGLICRANFCNYHCRSSEVFLGGHLGLCADNSVRVLGDMGFCHATYTHNPESFKRPRRFLLAVNEVTVVRAFLLGKQMWRMERPGGTIFKEIYDIQLTMLCDLTGFKTTVRVLLSPPDAWDIFLGWNKATGVVERLDVNRLLNCMSDCKFENPIPACGSRMHLVRRLAFMGEKIECHRPQKSTMIPVHQRKPATIIRRPTNMPCNHNFADQSFLWRCSNCGFHRTKSGVKFTR